MISNTGKLLEIKFFTDIIMLTITNRAALMNIFKPFELEELTARVRTLTGLKISVDKAMSAEMAFMQAQIKPHFLLIP